MSNFAQLLDDARFAGEQAFKACVPHAVVFKSGDTLYPEPEGLCGFAWINFPANTAFGRYCRENEIGRKDSYYGGRTIWVSENSQSYDRKVAYARAFCAVLNGAGVAAHVGSRLD